MGKHYDKGTSKNGASIKEEIITQKRCGYNYEPSDTQHLRTIAKHLCIVADQDHGSAFRIKLMQK